MSELQINCFEFRMGAWRNNGNDIAVVEERDRTFYIRCLSRSCWYFRDQTLICYLFYYYFLYRDSYCLSNRWNNAVNRLGTDWLENYVVFRDEIYLRGSHPRWPIAKPQFLLKKKQNRNTREGNRHNKITCSNLLFFSITHLAIQFIFCDICTEWNPLLFLLNFFTKGSCAF